MGKKREKGEGEGGKRDIQGLTSLTPHAGLVLVIFNYFTILNCHQCKHPI